MSQNTQNKGKQRRLKIRLNSTKFTNYKDDERTANSNDLKYFDNFNQDAESDCFDDNEFDKYLVYVMNQTTRYERMLPTSLAMGEPSTLFSNNLKLTTSKVITIKWTLPIEYKAIIIMFIT